MYQVKELKEELTYNMWPGDGRKALILEEHYQLNEIGATRNL